MALFLIASAAPVYAADTPTATCGDTSLVITNLPQDDRKVAIRINDKGNGWDLEKPFPGDKAEIITPKDGKYTFKATGKHTYDWWVHIENADGTYGSAIGSAVYCGAQAPTDLKATCRDSKLTLTWKKVSSADQYAVRVDDAVNPWNEKTAQAGDKSDNSVKSTTYTTTAVTGHGYNVWVHAIDPNGIFSPATESFVSCKPGGSGGFLQTLRDFFSNLF